MDGKRYAAGQKLLDAASGAQTIHVFGEEIFTDNDDHQKAG